MKTYSKQDYAISKAIRNISLFGVIEKGYLPPQFSTFSGMTPNNIMQRFNICILDKDTVIDDEFVIQYQKYHKHCQFNGICSFVFYHPDNENLNNLMQEQIHTATNIFINTNDLSAEFICSWLSADYLQGRLPNRLDYHLNRPVLKVKELHCPLCGNYFQVPSGLFFASLEANSYKKFIPIEQFMPVTQFTDNIGGNVFAMQMMTGQFELYNDSVTNYASPLSFMCPHCCVRIPLEIDELKYEEPDEEIILKPMWPIRLTDKDISQIHNCDTLVAPATGEWANVLNHSFKDSI